MPIESRTVPGPMSVQAACSVVNPRGCCIAGATTSDSVEPRLAVMLNSASDSANRVPASSPAARSKVTSVPNPSICIDGQRVAGISGQAWVANPAHLGSRREKFRDALRIGALGVPAHEIRLQAPQDQERRVRIERRTQRREIVPQRVDEFGTADDRAAHDVAVAGRVLGQAVGVQVHVELAVVVQPAERVVEQRERAVAARDRSDAPDVSDLEHRVGRRLEDHQPGRRRRPASARAHPGRPP